MTISKHRRRANMPLQPVKCPMCGKEDFIPQTRVAVYRTCSVMCRDKRLAKLARLRGFMEAHHATV